MLETISLESAIKYSTPLAKKIFESKIKPIISSKISQYIKNKSDKSTFERESVKYISSAAGQCSTINTIAFPNTPKKLDELYIPLNLVDDDGAEIVINDETDIFKHCDKILVSDTAGMGKSTLSKKVFTNIVNKQEYIPVFIELRQLDNQPIAKKISEKFGVKTDRPEHFLGQLPLVYLFDGLDEVPSKDKSRIIADIRRFIDALEGPKIMVTSRLESYLSEFYDFARYTIKPLDEKEAFSLISKYDPEGSVSEKLISGIRGSRDRDLKDFLSTPLYVSLLFCSYRYKTVIPQKKHLFYSQVYEALFESHDLSKEIGFVRPKHSNLDSSEFHSLLRRLGFWCLKNGGKIEFQRDEIEIVVQEIISNTNGINTSAANFVKDLTTTVPLFLKEGSSLRWSHKSLMEYFSSMFICNDAKEKQQDLFVYFYRSDSWSSYKNIFELCADIDFGSLRVSVVKEVLENYLEYYQSNYKNITNKRIKKYEIEERVGLTFCCVFGFRVLVEKSVPFSSDEFWGNDSADAIAVQEKSKDQNCEVSQFIMPLSSEREFLLANSLLSRESMIVNILKYKCPELFLHKSKSKVKVKTRNKSKSPFTRIGEVLCNSTIKKNKLYIVSDTPDELINNSKYFHVVNGLLSIVGVAALDPSKVKNELDKIEEDSSNGVDMLIDGMA